MLIGQPAKQIGDVLAFGVLPPEHLEQAIDRRDEVLVFFRKKKEERQNFLPVIEPGIRFGVEIAEPATALHRIVWLLPAVELLIAPEALDDVHADITGVGGLQHFVSGCSQDVAHRHAEHRVPEMADVENLVGIRLRMLDHHPVALRRAVAVGSAGREHFREEARRHRVLIEGDVDIAVDRLDLAELAGFSDPGRDQFGEGEGFGAGRARRFRLRFLL